MQEKKYTLKEILDSVMYITKNGTVKKRIIFDKSALGGMGSKWIIAGFVLLPFLVYAAIFNAKSFHYLGIAQAIVLYIVLLVVAMQVVVGISYLNNKKIMQMITPSWETYFPSVELKNVLSSGATPYVDFKKYYAQALQKGLQEEALHATLKKDFKTMQEEHKDLYEAMHRAKKNE
ncbi:MAG: hypothetical protein DSZ09_02095 [Sulfurovum sp.]|nr:MAG: hypothetical protein DSZ09_02095 [Sulfurovum sp.]